MGGTADTVDNPVLFEHLIEQNLGTCPPLPVVSYTAQSVALPPLPLSEDSDVEPDDSPLHPVPSPRTDTEDVLTVKKRESPDDVITLYSDDAQDTPLVSQEDKGHLLAKQLELAQSIIDQQKNQVARLKTDKAQLLHHASYLAQSVHTLGAAVDLPASPREVRKRRKMVTSGTWPRSLQNASRMSYHEIGGQ